METLEIIFKVILFFVGIGLIFYYAVLWDNDRKWWKSNADDKEKPLFIKSSITFIILSILFCVSLLLPNLKVANYSNELVLIFSIILSFFTSFLWFRFLTWLDAFEKEKTIYLILVFLLACGTIFLILPIDNFIASHYHFYFNGELWNDWWYSVLGIGLKEEIVKIIPVILVLKFTKQINEPIDYLIYGAVSALGFAFIENIQYLQNSNLMALEGRVLHASLAHMIFTSIITYSLAMRHNYSKIIQILIFPIALFIAAFSHGFYDFWLINPSAHKYSVLTYLFMLIAIKWWITMSSNLINISPYFNHKLKYPIRYFKYWLLNYFIAVFILGIVFINIIDGLDQSKAFFYYSFGGGDFFMILFITINLNGIDVIKNYTHSFKFPKKIIHLFLPSLTFHNNLVGRNLKIVHKKIVKNMVVDQELRSIVPIEGKLIRRMVCEDDKSWYLFQPKSSFMLHGVSISYLYIRCNDSEDDLSGKLYKNIETRIPKQIVEFEKPSFKRINTILLTNLLSKEIK